MQRVITNKDGRMETVQASGGVTKVDVDQSRRELRDMLDGNVQFHSDPNAAPVLESEADDPVWDSTKCRCSDPGAHPPCYYCSGGE